MSDNDDGFYVPDEPVQELLAAYEHGSKGVTALPVRERTTAAPSRLGNISASFFATGTTSTHAGATARFSTMAGTFRVTQRTA